LFCNPYALGGTYFDFEAKRARAIPGNDEIMQELQKLGG